jgi:hypothetical protein
MADPSDTAKLRALLARRSSAGRVQCDERGNARYHWIDELQGDSVDNTLLLKALTHPALKVEAPSAPAEVTDDPYNRSQPKPTQRGNPRDLRALSKRIEMKRKVSEQGEDPRRGYQSAAYER